MIPAVTSWQTERIGIIAANVIAVTILPMGLGRAGPRLLDFTVYVLAAGLVLTCMEDGCYVRGILDRPDVRAYLGARTVLVGVAALGPYLVAGVP